ncbi:MAG: hypothetical protein NT027_07450 [Proteobacteria bacterium]|nr:hypothetical protein [Pseudomonadota bacterium]
MLTLQQTARQVCHAPSTKHEVVVFKPTDGDPKQKVWAGEAFYDPSEDYFQLQLAIFPFPYFLTKNKESATTYTVWAQKVKDSSPVRFRRPVGRGNVTATKDSDGKQLSNYLEIDIPLLGLRHRPLLCLFPSN